MSRIPKQMNSFSCLMLSSQGRLGDWLKHIWGEQVDFSINVMTVWPFQIKKRKSRRVSKQMFI